MARSRKSVQKLAVSRSGAPETVSASTFKDTCLQLLERVQQTREQIVVTKYGRPIALLVAFDRSRPDLFGWLEGSVTIHGDIVGPSEEAWDAEG